MITVKFYCVVSNNGDGSASPLFYADRKTAQKACVAEESTGEAFSDLMPQKITLEFSDRGKLLNPDEVPDYD